MQKREERRRAKEGFLTSRTSFGMTGSGFGERLQEGVLEEAREGEDDEEGSDAEEGAEWELVLGGDDEAERVGIAVAQTTTGGARGEIAFPAGEIENDDAADANDAA